MIAPVVSRTYWLVLAIFLQVQGCPSASQRLWQSNDYIHSPSSTSLGASSNSGHRPILSILEHLFSPLTVHFTAISVTTKWRLSWNLTSNSEFGS